MKKIWSVVFLTFAAALFMSAMAGASEVGILIDKLVEKGILTSSEAQIIVDETHKEAVRQIPKIESKSVPRWVQSLKIKGDFRLRFEHGFKEETSDPRNRGRVRYRLELGSEINDHLKVAAGLVSGGDDPRSTNQSFQNSFDTGDIRLDYAFVQYSPNSWLTLAGGKFPRKTYLWTPTDLLWDGDINPEGGSVHMEHSLTNNVESFINSGVWVLDENGTVDKPDPFLMYVQGGVSLEKGSFNVRLAGIYYNFNGFKGTDPEWSKDSNTRVGDIHASGPLKYDYDSGGVSGELGVSKPLELVNLNLPIEIEKLTGFGEYIYNPDPGDNNAGWAAGLKLGNKEIKNKGQWVLKWIYAYLTYDAFPDIFPDSDRFSGKTNVRGYEVILQYGLAKNVVAGIDYYNSRQIKGSKNIERLCQADIVIKF